MKTPPVVAALRACLAATRRPFGTGRHSAPPPPDLQQLPQH